MTGWRLHSSRRRLLGGLMGGAAALASGLTARAADLNGSLRFGTYGGVWRDHIEKLIGLPLRARGADVQYVLGTPSDNLARLIAARGRETPIDCLESEGASYVQFSRGKFLQKINFANIPNAAPVPAFARSDDAIATAVVLHGIVYNEQKFAEAGVPAPQSLKDLANPKLAGRIAFPDIANEGHYYSVVIMAYEAGGDETTLDKALPEIAKLNPAAFPPNSIDLASRFGKGEIWAAPWHVGWAVRLKRAGVPAAISYPDVGGKNGIMALTYSHILAGSKNTPAAEAFINLYLDPDVQFEFTRFSGFIPTNPQALTRLAALPELKGLVRDDAADLEKARRIDFGKIPMTEWRERWERRPG